MQLKKIVKSFFKSKMDENAKKHFMRIIQKKYTV